MRLNDPYIIETSHLFKAIALHKSVIVESKLDEGPAWDAIKKVVGAPIRGIKSASDAYDKLLIKAQETKPVQQFDEKIDKLIAGIAKKNPTIANAVTKYAEWAKKNPIKQSLILAAIVAVASIAATSVGAGAGVTASVGFVLRGLNELLKGETASTAIGKGVKGAVAGAAAGAAAGVVAGPIADFFKGWRIKNIPLPDMPEFIQKRISVPGSSRVVTLLKSDDAKIMDIWNKLETVRGKDDWSSLAKISSLMNDYKNLLYDLSSREYLDKMLKIAQDANFVRQAAINNDSAVQAIDKVYKTVTAMAQGAATAGTGVKSDTFKQISTMSKTLDPTAKKLLAQHLKTQFKL